MGIGRVIVARNLLILSVFFVGIQFFSCQKRTEQPPINEVTDSGTKTKITFIELGSVNCIPCKQMQPVMKSIEEKYKGQVKVVFYDVWKDRRPAEQYGIKLIPTQIFLDENGKEILRHEGFFPEEEIDKFLTSNGLHIMN
jgi:thioredoxin 1